MQAKLMRVQDVIEATGMSRSSIYAAMTAGDFPRPVRIGRRAVAWRHDDIETWIDALPRAEPAEAE